MNTVPWYYMVWLITVSPVEDGVAKFSIRVTEFPDMVSTPC